MTVAHVYTVAFQGIEARRSGRRSGADAQRLRRTVRRDHYKIRGLR
jgi:hypothetical protein